MTTWSPHYPTEYDNVQLQRNLQQRQAENHQCAESPRRGKLPTLRRQPVDRERVCSHRGPGDERARQQRWRDDPGSDDRLPALWIHRATCAAASRIVESRSYNLQRYDRSARSARLVLLTPPAPSAAVSPVVDGSCRAPRRVAGAAASRLSG